MYGRSYPIIFYAFRYRIAYNFHHDLRFGAKNRFYSVFNFMARDDLVFGPFLTLSNISELLTHILVMVFQVQLASDMKLDQAIP